MNKLDTPSREVTEQTAKQSNVLVIVAVLRLLLKQEECPWDAYFLLTAL